MGKVQQIANLYNITDKKSLDALADIYCEGIKEGLQEAKQIINNHE